LNTSRSAALLTASLMAFGAWAEGPVLRLTEEQMQAWRTAKEDCGELAGALCKRKFREIPTPEQRTFHAVDDKYDAGGAVKADVSKSATVFRLSDKQVGDWGRIAKTCGDPHGGECKRRFKAMLTPEQRTLLGIWDQGSSDGLRRE